MDKHVHKLYSLVNYDFFSSRYNDTVMKKWKKDLAEMDLGDQKGIFAQSDLVSTNELVKLYRSAVLRAKETIREQREKEEQDAQNKKVIEEKAAKVDPKGVISNAIKQIMHDEQDMAKGKGKSTFPGKGNYTIDFRSQLDDLLQNPALLQQDAMPARIRVRRFTKEEMQRRKQFLGQSSKNGFIPGGARGTTMKKKGKGKGKGKMIARQAKGKGKGFGKNGKGKRMMKGRGKGKGKTMRPKGMGKGKGMTMKGKGKSKGKGKGRGTANARGFGGKSSGKSKGKKGMGKARSK